MIAYFNISDWGHTNTHKAIVGVGSLGFSLSLPVAEQRNGGF